MREMPTVELTSIKEQLPTWLQDPTDRDATQKQEQVPAEPARARTNAAEARCQERDLADIRT